MARYIDLNNPKIIHMGRDKYGNGIYHIPPDLPTADVRENVKAHWVGIDDEPYEVRECDRCGYIIECYENDRTNFCPNCGALMVKGEEDERIKNS